MLDGIILMVHADHRNGKLTKSGEAQVQSAAADLIVEARGRSVTVVTTDDNSSLATVEALESYASFETKTYGERLKGKRGVRAFLDFVRTSEVAGSLMFIVGPGDSIEELAVIYAKQVRKLEVDKPRLGYGQRIQLCGDCIDWSYLD